MRTMLLLVLWASSESRKRGFVRSLSVHGPTTWSRVLCNPWQLWQRHRRLSSCFGSLMLHAIEILGLVMFSMTSRSFQIDYWYSGFYEHPWKHCGSNIVSHHKASPLLSNQTFPYLQMAKDSWTQNNPVAELIVLQRLDVDSNFQPMNETLSICADDDFYIGRNSSLWYHLYWTRLPILKLIS